MTNAITSKGHSIDFLVFKESSTDHLFNKTNIIYFKISKVFLLIKLIFLKTKKKPGFLRKFGIYSFRQSIKYFTNERPDIIILRDFNLASLMTYLISKFFRVKSIYYTIKDLESLSKMNKFKKILIPKIMMTPISSNNLLKKENIYYIPLPYETKLNVNVRKYFKNNRINILMVGKFNLTRKNHLMLLRTFKEIMDYFSNLHLHFVGFGSVKDETFNEVKGFINKYQLSKEVSISLEVPFDKMDDEYIKHDIFILPSHNEPYGMSLVEAASNGLALIISDTVGAKNLIETDINGLIFESNNQTDLREKLIYLINNKVKISSFGLYNTDLIKKNYTKSRFNELFSFMLTNEFGMKY